MAAKGSPNQIIKPTWGGPDGIQEFFQVALGKSVEEVLRLFELWSINGAEGTQHMLIMLRKTLMRYRNRNRTQYGEDGGRYAL